MGLRHPFHRERPDGNSLALRDGTDLDFAGETRFLQLALQQRRREAGGIDRTAQLGPQMRHRAEMILMTMGQHDAEQILAALDDEGRVGHEHFDARRGLVTEGDAEIDHQPFAAIAVKAEIHADLADAAQGQKNQFRCFAHIFFLSARRRAYGVRR